jgi:hypothetical protein
MIDGRRTRGDGISALVNELARFLLLVSENKDVGYVSIACACVERESSENTFFASQ